MSALGQSSPATLARAQLPLSGLVGLVLPAVSVPDSSSPWLIQLSLGARAGPGQGDDPWEGSKPERQEVSGAPGKAAGPPTHPAASLERGP